MAINKYYGKFLYGILLYENTDDKDCNKKNLEYVLNNNSKTFLCYFKITDHNKTFCLHNDLNISYYDFPWKSYLKINRDINESVVNTKQIAWHYWKTLGKKEERSFSYINNSNIHCGRFGNIFFINMYLNLMSIKFQLKCNYKYEQLFNKLGIYFNLGNKIYETNALINDYNFLYSLKENITPCNVIIGDAWFHTNEFSQIITEYFEDKTRKRLITHSNKYKKRYKRNNDLFIHLRLGDVSNYNDKQDIHNRICNQLKNIVYDKGYISSDTINDKLCEKLIEKYKLKTVKYDETHTIQFGSTCNNIILSGGTFSWMIGLFAFYSNLVCYLDLKNKWYGDIFNNPKWKKI